MSDPQRPGDLERSPIATLGAEELVASPAWLPLEVTSTGSVRLVRLTEADYRAASFLDQRLLQTQPLPGQSAVSTVAAAAARLAPSAHFLFHIGHVGSTLLARLLGEHPTLFALREPMLLRAAIPGPDGTAGGLTIAQQVALLSRTWRPDQRALIKTTSFVNEIAADLLTGAPDARALLLYTPALTYLRAILAGPNSRLETRALAPSRLERLRHRVAVPIPTPGSEGQWVAMSWLCEMTTLLATAARVEARIRWMDFERFLLEPAANLAAALAAVGAAPDTRDIDRVLHGPLMRVYAKAPQYAYDPSLRRTVLAQADRECRGEIRAGMDWLEQLRAVHPLLAAALAR
ncbi:MAG: hypothetical protein ACYCT1_09200 [Steroidobacteraceae bacterium]